MKLVVKQYRLIAQRRNKLVRLLKHLKHMKMECRNGNVTKILSAAFTGSLIGLLSLSQTKRHVTVCNSPALQCLHHKPVTKLKLE
jgi:hypothetical protein